LVGDDLHHRAEVPRANDGHYFKSRFLLLLEHVLLHVGVVDVFLPHSVERNKVNREHLFLANPVGEGAILDAGEDVASETELDVLALKVVNRVQLAGD